MIQKKFYNHVNKLIFVYSIRRSTTQITRLCPFFLEKDNHLATESTRGFCIDGLFWNYVIPIAKVLDTAFSIYIFEFYRC